MWGVSVAIGVLAIIGAVLLATVGKLAWPRITAALMLTGSAGLIGGTFGPMLHRAVTRADQAAGQAVGKLTGVVITGLIGLVMLLIWALWVYQGQLDMRTIGLSSAIPLVVNLIPGALGTAVTTIVGIVPWFVSGFISLMFFGQWGG